MILKNLEKYKIILGSKSPRRQNLLKGIGLDFTVKIIDDIDETYPEHLTKEEIPVYLAKLKAGFYKNVIDEKTLLITADTIVWINNRVLGKPVDKNDAIKILKELSGTMHQVITGVCIKTKEKEVTFHSISDVYFAKLTLEEIEYYIDNYKPYDKAGSYGVQEFIGYIGVDKIEGSYFNVMGLPIHKLYEELKKI